MLIERPIEKYFFARSGVVIGVSSFPSIVDWIDELSTSAAATPAAATRPL